MIVKHKDKTLNALRLLAFGATAFYMYKAWKKEGTLSGAAPNSQFGINSDRVVDTISPWINLPPEQKNLISNAAKSFLKNYLEEKGIQTNLEGNKK